MNVHPLLSTLRRHKTAAGLIVLEIALTCAIVSNAIFLIMNRLDRMAYPSGIAESELVHLQLVGSAGSRDTRDVSAEDLAALRAVPGVRAAAATNQIPYGHSSWNSMLNMTADQAQPTAVVTTYIGSQDLVETMGLDIVAGRDFNPDEYITFDELQAGAKTIPSVIVTRTLAERLFPGDGALGKIIFVWGEQGSRIVGVVDRLIRPNDMGGPGERDYSVVLPVGAPSLYGHSYLVRVDDPARREEVLTAASEALERVNPSRILIEDDTRTLSQFREDYYQADQAMAWLLVAVCVALLVVTALGIVGLASFWVQQRTRQIGIRRALGATRAQVLHYFQMENLLIASIGIFVGMALAYGINGALMERYELPRLPWQYLPAGAVLLWLLGQGAVLGPALRAAAVPPAVATRSV